MIRRYDNVMRSKIIVVKELLRKVLRAGRTRLPDVIFSAARSVKLTRG